tara:strand:+ start:362 stop:550 length:189 start_codon:yes stop_codon:yes gene_type:complete
MAFYIKAKDNTVNYKDDGTQVYKLDNAKSYSTEAAAQAVIDSNPSWITALKNAGETMTVVEI